MHASSSSLQGEEFHKDLPPEATLYSDALTTLFCGMSLHRPDNAGADQEGGGNSPQAERGCSRDRSIPLFLPLQSSPAAGSREQSALRQSAAWLCLID